MKLILMFPGQSSVYPTMLEDLTGVDELAGQVLATASEILGRDLAAHYKSDNPAIFATNRDIQVGMFLANHLYLSLLEQAGIEADLSLGLSFGEYNHLVHIGALSFEQALLTVNRCGELYEAGPQGAMAAIFPLEMPQLERIVAEVSRAELGIIEIANLNSPRQNVISGSREALTRALELISDEFYVEGIVIENKIPMHSSLFQPVGRQLGHLLARLDFKRPERPYLPNRLGAFLPAPTSQDFCELLASHVYKSVWFLIFHLVERITNS